MCPPLSAARHQQTDRQPAVSIHNIDSHRTPPTNPPSTADAVTGAMMMIWDFACSSSSNQRW